MFLYCFLFFIFGDIISNTAGLICIFVNLALHIH
ncbi:hypothetical protein EUBVEN_01401 [Eubacterium ventriosum ATCC 27560]|uniref:Uncharacterized protein n=1 Tax=Eubacterium ventriosum ATCC 27560 TaxID=411463 RepID=A5Z6R9_9FIRM|nr:hypothetical protein EUBVEN_01401 [Eubacterium ventriosum ATCC 27560]